MLMKLTPGLDFINILHTAFTPVVPQGVRTQSSCHYLFTLLGPRSVKAVRRTLMNLTTDRKKTQSGFPLTSALLLREFLFRCLTIVVTQFNNKSRKKQLKNEANQSSAIFVNFDGALSLLGVK